MSQELFYTSAPAGLKPGTKGFCTVAMTAGMSGLLVQRLEMLSGYRELFPPGDANAAQNPVAWSHWRLSAAGQTNSVLSRVCFAGMDYTQRANTFAHHVVLGTSEQSAGGPAWVMSQPGVMESNWEGAPRLIPQGRQIPAADDPPRICSAWEAAAGDAGWAGALAETASSDGSNTAYIIYAPGTDMVALIREAMALLSPRQRWQTTFCTYFTELPAGLNCAWRCCVAGTPAAKEARRYATSGVVIDLTQPCGVPEESQLAQIARTGEWAIPEPAPVHAPLITVAGHPVYSESLPDRSLKLAEPVGMSSGANQNWMPPLNATLVERDATDSAPNNVERPNSKSRVGFWLFSLIWPLVLIGIVVAWRENKLASVESELSQAKSAAATQIDENSRLTARNQGLISETREAERERDDAKQEAAKEDDTIGGLRLDLQAKNKQIELWKPITLEIESLRSKNAGLTDLLAQYTKPKTDPGPPTSAPTIADSDIEGTVEIFDPNKRILWESPSATVDKIELVSPLPKPEKIDLPQSESVLAASISSQGQTYFAVAWNQQKLAISRFDADKFDKLSAKGWLSLSFIRLWKGKDVIRKERFVQLREYNVILDPGNVSPPTITALPGSAVPYIGIVPRKEPNDWTIEVISPTELKLNHHDAEFSLKLDTATGNIVPTSTWQKTRSDFAKKLGDAIAMVDHLHSTQDSDQKDINDLNNQISDLEKGSKNDSESKKKIDDLKNDVKNKKDSQQQNTIDLDKSQHDRDAAKAGQDALDQIGDFDAEIICNKYQDPKDHLVLFRLHISKLSK